MNLIISICLKCPSKVCKSTMRSAKKWTKATTSTICSKFYIYIYKRSGVGRSQTRRTYPPLIYCRITSKVRRKESR
ncbi:hypothetical protein BUALT_Bualt05G0046100 [Buddleja alternifolia]|uniref:Uncharacterized protein n=1 Tax=Buddleja alternifolia TaxID=168488 RepID=A0AAV6XPH3_9LAMI|nr:hypothetical protein BUALT_Bualt05G0046100 [Buddleja alternifolia]